MPNHEDQQARNAEMIAMQRAAQKAQAYARAGVPTPPQLQQAMAPVADVSMEPALDRIVSTSLPAPAQPVQNSAADASDGSGMPFGEAFHAARQAGLKQFMWNGKPYTTQLREEVQVPTQISAHGSTTKPIAGDEPELVDNASEEAGEELANMQAADKAAKDKAISPIGQANLNAGSDLVDKMLTALGIGGAGAIIGATAAKARGGTQMGKAAGNAAADSVLHGNTGASAKAGDEGTSSVREETPNAPKQLRDSYGNEVRESPNATNHFGRNGTNRAMTDEDLFGKMLDNVIAGQPQAMRQGDLTGNPNDAYFRGTGNEMKDLDKQLGIISPQIQDKAVRNVGKSVKSGEMSADEGVKALEGLVGKAGADKMTAILKALAKVR